MKMKRVWRRLMAVILALLLVSQTLPDSGLLFGMAADKSTVVQTESSSETQDSSVTGSSQTTETTEAAADSAAEGNNTATTEATAETGADSQKKTMRQTGMVEQVNLNNGIGNDGVGGKITKAEMEMYIDGTWMTLDEVREWLDADAGNKIPKDTQVSVSVAFEMGENTFLSEDSTIVYTLPDAFAAKSEENVAMYDADSPNDTIGLYSIDGTSRVVTITPDTDFLEEHEGKISEGSFYFEGTFTDAWWDNPQDISFGGDVGDVNVPFDGGDVSVGNLSIEKTMTGEPDYEEGTIGYQIIVTAPSDNTVTMTDVTVNDNWQNGQWVIGDLAPGTTCTLTYNLKTKDGYSFYDSALQGTIANTAAVYSGDTAMDTASAQ